MAYSRTPRTQQNASFSPPRASPLRNSSIASTNSSSYSDSSNPFGPTRTSTISSAASSSYQATALGQKRDLTQAGMASGHRYTHSADSSPNSTYKNVRQSLRPLPQPPNSQPSSVNKSRFPESHQENIEEQEQRTRFRDQYSPTPTPLPNSSRKGHSHSSSLSHSDSVALPTLSPKGFHADHLHSGPRSGVLAPPDLNELQHSSTSHLRNLSKLTQGTSSDSFSLSSPSVVGLQNRRQLKRTDSTRANIRGKVALTNGEGFAWSGRNWMDTQRQFLQAYEYLCHIGEAKEWIEDIIQKPIPPIVQLEEALRDGVTLAEIVQAMKPNQHVRIFHHPRLQYRHSDNIAVFFRFLSEIELPELFRFELIDLYEKKNIPKVIYCIHALSWLLFRNGMVDFRIGNLVGQLKFEDHELEAMQKGLDKAGVSMPSFSGMGASFGAEPEPEPVESEEERIDRELGENEASIAELQAQIRGCLVRFHLGDQMQGLWDSEQMLIDLQSRIRGDWARQISDYRLNMKRFAVNLQSAARGFIIRGNQQNKQSHWKAHEPQVVKLQSLVRAMKARAETQLLKKRIRHEESGIRQFQAAIRGAMERKRFDEQYDQAQRAQSGVETVQAAIRGMLERKRFQEQETRLNHSQKAVTLLQAAARAMQTRSAQARQQQALIQNTGIWKALQAASQGMLARSRIQETKKELQDHSPMLIKLQAISRGGAIRNQVNELRSSLTANTDTVINLQAFCRGLLLRVRQAADLQALDKCSSQVIQLQAHTLGFLFRGLQSNFLGELRSYTSEVVQLQALTRAMMVRVEVGNDLAALDEEEEVIEALQAAARGMIVRAHFAEKQRHFKENMEKVVKVQSFVRAKLQGQAYKSLTSGKNPPVGTVKNFVHLLNDSDFDFDEEVEFERLRKTVVQHVRQNEMADQYIQQLDIKIALLVKNKITLDEVVKHQKHFGGSVGSLLTNSEISSKDPFDLKALNKNSRRKLEHYQEMFFILQTQPQYLARQFRRIREANTPEKDCEKTRHLIMGLFGYAQKRREEYYLLKLITRSMKEEVDSCRNLQEYLRGNFFWAKLFGAYIKNPRDRKFMRDLLGPIVKESIVDSPDLDLESDPLQIYLAAIQNEQLRTGQRSTRPTDVTRDIAIKDEETKRTFIAHLQDLREIADQVFGALEDTLHRMPYGLRYVAQQMFDGLISRFQHEEPTYIIQIVGNWIWKNYLQPALSDPEKFGVVDRSLAPEHRRNLGEVVKVLSQISAGRLFGQDNVFLQPLNSYVTEAISRISDIWHSVIDVPEPELQFDIDEFNDLYAKTKPTLYIKMADIFAIHHMLAADTGNICPQPEDALREVIRELGSARTNESELIGVGTSEICLTLTPKLHNADDPEAEVKALFMECKRCVLYIIRVQSGANLMEIMVKPITMEDEEKWRTLVRDELSANSRKRGAYSEANTLIDIASMTYSELKRTALENILRLEQPPLSRLSRHNHYQDLLNAIAIDIRTKHRRRVQRQNELAGVRQTLSRLNEQALYLEGQLKTYNDYIEQAMVTLQNKKGKKRFLVPFTKQWEHERELQRTGRVPKFGSFKYSAQELANRGILVAWQGYGERQWIQLDLTISSNDVGVFNIEGSSGSIAMPGASAQLPLDDLLQAQYNGTQFLEFFGAGEKVKVNVNLFLHLIMRKFYKDRDS